MTVLLREAIGDQLRRVRTGQGRTLRDVSTDARVSLGYLSEVERGQKEASSELLASICVALEVEISDVLRDVAGAMAPVATLQTDALVEVIAPQGDAAAALAAA
ncbi:MULTISPECIES: helix-turn-helix domain-containing protein [Gordonia]|uniref:Putative Xre family DNA-binding protein n=1 Tax=Gordonia malaquae NBRC 108250 TaxID=1223542 RepID=M3UKZ7_GORML|nr:helix-turn-helix transcriptional regulator [Gordonia malaquae]MDR2281036.1 helix-turn-helix domain-containing protein [Gordonia sp. (in: high G+C Gram-positive bacteria)]GAC80330.1 putative Xre family DNA-binding protein [Gordonia malaquae NBRC 108250]SEC53397.1 Helix-turn-helix domain-containing protein [Gordonia malaquae]